MGLIYRFSKSGKGITKEEALKRSYFNILWRKLSRLSVLNILYFLCNIVFFALSVFLMWGFFTGDENELADFFINISKGRALLPILPFVPLMFTGPTTAGLTYVCRNFARQEHAFVASDFFEHTKKNFKQGMLAGIILTLVFYLYLNAAVYYYLNFPSSAVISAVLGCFLIIASFYVYPLMVTFDMSLKDIFKNSILFALSNLPWNLLTLAALVAVHGLLVLFLSSLHIVFAVIIWVVLMAVFLIAWSSFTINFTTWGAIQKNINNN
ncbi:MAG: DUF624 domain-containing protein [Clostridia bacterium]|nr:DUF624 domain-containing protein [Clostridia bacterium]